MELFLTTSLVIISLFWTLSLIINVQDIGIDENDNQGTIPIYY